MQFASLVLFLSLISFSPILFAQETTTQHKEIKITGEIHRDQVDSELKFNLQFGIKGFYYLMQGSTTTVEGYFSDDVNFTGVNVTKELPREFAPLNETTETLENRGIISVYKRQRQAKDVHFAGHELSGYCLDGWLDDGLWFEGLKFDDTESKGILDYNSRNGYYNTKDGCTFGSSVITSTKNSFVINYDDWGQDKFTLNMNFGKLVVEGTIDFVDEDVKQKDGTKKKITVAKHTISVTRADRKALVLALPNQPMTEDDLELTRLIAFFELTAYDLYAE